MLGGSFFYGLEFTHQVKVIASMLRSYCYFCSFHTTIIIWKIDKVYFCYKLALFFSKLSLDWLNFKLLSFVINQFTFKWSFTIFELNLKNCPLTNIRTYNNRFIFRLTNFHSQLNPFSLIFTIVKHNITIIY